MDRLRLNHLFILLSLILSGCLNSDDRNNNDNIPAVNTPSVMDTSLSSMMKSLGMNGDPMLERSLPSIQSAKAQLGMKLFFSKSMGGEMDMAYVSCHHPALSGGDGLRRQYR